MRRFVESVSLAAVSICLWSIVFLQDYEINSVRDLLQPGVWPVLLVLGAALWLVLTGLAKLLAKGRRTTFLTLAALTGFAVTGLIWLQGGYRGPDGWLELRNFLALMTLFFGMLAGSTVLARQLGRLVS